MPTFILVIGPAIALLLSVVLSVFLTKWVPFRVRYIVASLVAVTINLVGQFIYFLPVLNSLYPPGPFGGIAYLIFLGVSLLITTPFAIIISVMLIKKERKNEENTAAKNF